MPQENDNSYNILASASAVREKDNITRPEGHGILLLRNTTKVHLRVSELPLAACLCYCLEPLRNGSTTPVLAPKQGFPVHAPGLISFPLYFATKVLD